MKEFLMNSISSPTNVRVTILKLFWLGLALAMPIGGLAGWYCFGLDNPGAWRRDKWERWLMLSTAALVAVLHGVVLVLLFLESKSAKDI